MSRWFRVYDDIINDPKILKLPEESRWHWVALLCVASKNDGVLPSTEDVAISLRVKTAAAAVIIANLKNAGLLDLADGRYVPHNWGKRQFKSDTSNERVKRYRERKCNVTETVTVTPPDTDTETEQIQTEAKASDAGASDPRTRLFREGLATVARLTGKGPDSCRSFLGKCLKEVGDDAIVVLAAIEDAERNQVIDPSAYIAKLLKGRSNGQSRSGIIQAADDLRRRIASFDGPPSGDKRVRSGESAPVVRLLPNG